MRRELALLRTRASWSVLYGDDLTREPGVFTDLIRGSGRHFLGQVVNHADRRGRTQTADFLAIAVVNSDSMNLTPA